MSGAQWRMEEMRVWRSAAQFNWYSVCRRRATQTREQLLGFLGLQYGL